MYQNTPNCKLRAAQNLLPLQLAEYFNDIWYYDNSSMTVLDLSFRLAIYSDTHNYYSWIKQLSNTSCLQSDNSICLLLVPLPHDSFFSMFLHSVKAFKLCYLQLMFHNVIKHECLLSWIHRTLFLIVWNFPYVLLVLFLCCCTYLLL